MWHYVTSFHPCTVQLYNCMQSLHVDWVERLQRPSICFGGVRCTAPKDAQRARPLWPVWHRVAGVAQFGHTSPLPQSKTLSFAELRRFCTQIWAHRVGLLPGHALDVTPCDSNSNHLPLCHFTSKGIQNRGEAQRMQEWRRMRKNEEERWNVIAITRLLR